MVDVANMIPVHRDASLVIHARLSEIAGGPVYVEVVGGVVQGTLHGSTGALTRVAAHFGFRYSSRTATSSDPRLTLTSAKMRSVST